MNDLDRELDAALARWRDEDLPEAALASVRAGVHERIQAGRRKRAYVAWLSLAAAAAIASIAIAIPWTTSTLPLASPRAPQADAMALARPALRPAWMGASSNSVVARGAARRGAPAAVVASAKPPAPEPPEEQTQFIRIITDDPNVVILWALNSKGETR